MVVGTAEWIMSSLASHCLTRVISAIHTWTVWNILQQWPTMSPKRGSGLGESCPTGIVLCFVSNMCTRNGICFLSSFLEGRISYQCCLRIYPAGAIIIHPTTGVKLYHRSRDWGLFYQTMGIPRFFFEVSPNGVLSKPWQRSHSSFLGKEVKRTGWLLYRRVLKLVSTVLELK